MNKYLTKAILMTIFTSFAGVLGVIFIPSIAAAVLFSVALLVIHSVGLVVLGYFEIKAEFMADVARLTRLR